MRPGWIRTVGVLAAVLLSPLAIAADHADGTPTTLNNPDASADITDLFAWMTSDGTKLNLVMDVFPGAMGGATASKFSNAVKYVFHTSSGPAFGMPMSQANVICTFSTSQAISCWVVRNGSTIDYVTGDASNPSGLMSASGKFKVFAGPRDDPFFFNLAGFRNATRAVARYTPPSVDSSGCPSVDAPTSTALVTALQKDCTGAASPFDFFAKPTPGSNTACPTGTTNQPLTGNILGIVVQLDKTLVTQGGPVVSVWASTNQ